MTDQEAIKLIYRAITEIEWEQPMEYAAAFDRAIEALKLRKELAPRVLTLEEVLDAVFCYLEDKAYGTIEPAIFGEADTDDTVAFTTLEDGNDYLDLSDYCKAWRCWNTRPTDEQREATPWDELPKEGDEE